MQVHLRVESERSCRRMRRGHLRQRPHHRQRDARSTDKAQYHRRASQLHGYGAPKKQSRSDGAAQPDHGDLPRGEVLVKSRFTFNNPSGIRRCQDCARLRFHFLHGGHRNRNSLPVLGPERRASKRRGTTVPRSSRAAPGRFLKSLAWREPPAEPRRKS